jgi:para-aminobenzoate synthetase / 4-amino-4-deoxychorismate lyase
MLLARIDDLRTGHSFRFDDRLISLEATKVNEVHGVLQAAERFANDGHWVVGYVAYEAGAAFDPAFSVVSAASALPLVRFDVFRTRIPVTGLDAADAPNHRIQGLRRTAGTMAYPEAVEAIRRRIELGDVYQVNHTDRFVGELSGDPFDLYVSMALAQRGAYNAYLDLGTHIIVSASPELFLRWDDDTLTAKPMKGTVVRGRRKADDENRQQELVQDPKQRAENVMIVDLLRNDLSRVAVVGSVRVPRLFEAERYETVWQLTSTVEATPAPNTTLAAVLAATFPCGSITGAPKASAMAIIAGLEGRPRGVYCGAIGVLSPPGQGPRAVFSVAIRTAVIAKATGELTYGAGGGITWSSEPEAEDAEVQAKARVLSERRPPMQLLETMHLGPTGIRNRQRHLDRLMASAAWFGFLVDSGDVCSALDRLSPCDNEQRVRLLVSRNGDVVVETFALGPVAPIVTLAVDSRPVRSDDVFCLHKTTNRAVYDAAKARYRDADDVVLVNERGEVVETTIANLLYRLGDQWFTPPLSSGGLDGIGRSVEIAAGRVSERVLHASELAQCDELAVVSCLRGIRRAVLHW